MTGSKYGAAFRAEGTTIDGERLLGDRAYKYGNKVTFRGLNKDTKKLIAAIKKGEFKTIRFSVVTHFRNAYNPTEHIFDKGDEALNFLKNTLSEINSGDFIPKE